MLDLNIGALLEDPGAGRVSVEDVTPGGTVKLRIVASGICITRPIERVRTFERVYEPAKRAHLAAWVAITISAIGVIILCNI